jgi:uncharacterized membrane protein
VLPQAMERDSLAAFPWSVLAVIAGMYVASFVTRRPLHASRESGTQGAADVEEAVRVVLSLSATGLLTLFVGTHLEPGAVTLSWGLEGLALLAVGLAARERVLRLSGLALLFVCIVKLFLYDLRELEALARIFSFVVLGLVLLAVSWTYTRFRTEIRKFL